MSRARDLAAHGSESMEEFMRQERPDLDALQCDMHDGCRQAVSMIDDSGYVFCTNHGLDRREWRRCRKLRPHELRRLERGEPLTTY